MFISAVILLFILHTEFISCNQLKVEDLAKCSYQVEPVGCFNDVRDVPGKQNRALPTQVLNSRDRNSDVYFLPPINWKKYHHWLANFICECAKQVLESKKTSVDYIGIQYYGECWANLDPLKKSEYARYGTSANCKTSSYAAISEKKNKCEAYTGADHANYVYKVSRYSDAVCPLYFESRGCWNDNNPRLSADRRPLDNYILNERDPYHENWQGRFIEWGKWQTTYLPSFLCRCAHKAKELGFKYFGIQFYGECWAGNDQTNFQRDGAGSRCIGRDFKHCPETDNMCPPNACAGEWSTNKVYEIHQGPLACLSNPCKHGTCKQNGPDDFICECPSGKTGKLCE